MVLEKITLSFCTLMFLGIWGESCTVEKEAATAATDARRIERASQKDADLAKGETRAKGAAADGSVVSIDGTRVIPPRVASGEIGDGPIDGFSVGDGDVLHPSTSPTKLKDTLSDHSAANDNMLASTSNESSAPFQQSIGPDTQSLQIEVSKTFAKLATDVKSRMSFDVASGIFSINRSVQIPGIEIKIGSLNLYHAIGGGGALLLTCSKVPDGCISLLKLALHSFFGI